MKTLLISNITIANATNPSIIGNVFIEDGKITEVAGSITEAAELHIDAMGKNWTVVPGFIDLHIHGSSSFDTMDATPEALNGLASALPSEGTTSFLANNDHAVR